MYTKNSQGFTLIELMVVIAIIAILTAASAVSFASARAKARDATRLSDLKEISLALEVYRQSVSNRKYPAALSSLVPTYLVKLPTNPQGSAYTYTPTSCTYGTVLAVQVENTTNGNSAAACGDGKLTEGAWYVVIVGPVTP